MVLLQGSEGRFIECFESLYNGPEAPGVFALVRRKYEWIVARREIQASDPATARKMRGSINELKRDHRERGLFNAVLDKANAVRIEESMLRAQFELLRTVGTQNLRMRIGIVGVPKQAASTDDVWPSHVMTPSLYRGVTERPRDHVLLVVVSKNLNGPVVLPGPTCVIKLGERPIDAALKVLKSIREADPTAEIIDIDLDDLEAQIASLHSRQPRPLPLELPCRLEDRGVTDQPIALFLSDAFNTSIRGSAIDLRGMRVGVNVEWVYTSTRTIEEVHDGVVIPRLVEIKVSKPVQMQCDPRVMTCRIARIAATSEPSRISPVRSTLVAVFGATNPEKVTSMALSTVGDTDGARHVRSFIARRQFARVLNGAHQTRAHLHVDRATSAVALTADLLGEHARV